METRVWAGRRSEGFERWRTSGTLVGNRGREGVLYIPFGAKWGVVSHYRTKLIVLDEYSREQYKEHSKGPEEPGTFSSILVGALLVLR